jgi:hypothetical protein
MFVFQRLYSANRHSHRSQIFHLVPVDCPVCGVTRPEDKLEAHLRNTHTAEVTQACDMCTKTFQNKALLR